MSKAATVPQQIRILFRLIAKMTPSTRLGSERPRRRPEDFDHTLAIAKVDCSSFIVEGDSSA